MTAPPAIAPWLVPILWREHDWVAALGRLSRTATRANRLSGSRAFRTAIELAQALEYVDPDRRHTIAVYELAGDHERARELASELGWWSARARLSARIIDSPEHVLDEAGAWWDAGHPDLCALALAEVRGSDRGARGADLEALLEERDLARHAAESVARAKSLKGLDAANAYMMAARFARADHNLDELRRWLEAAIVAYPKHPVAAPFLLELGCQSRDAAQIKRYLTLVLQCATSLEMWIDEMRVAAFTLMSTEHFRGFGQRLVRQILQKAYKERPRRIPGHLAMWTALASQATTSSSRRELLPFVITALDASTYDVDRVWLAAYATEIALRDAANPVVAGAYAEVVAECAPDHPIVRELVAAVAEVEEEPTSPIEIPIAAITAAKQDVHVERAIDLDAAYAAVSEQSDESAVVHDRPPVEALVPAPPAPTPTTPARLASTLPAMPSIPIPRVVPTLAALRTPDRPAIPPRPADPPNAKLRAHRIAVPIDLRLELPDGNRADATSRDISTTGLFVTTSVELELDAELDATLLLPGAEAFTEDEFLAKVRVVRRDDHGYGLELIAPTPELVVALDNLT